MKLDEIKKIIIGEMPFLMEKYGVKEIGVFGSAVRGEQKEGSDVDVLVEFSKPITLFGYSGLQRYLEEKLDSKVDLVSKKGLKPIIKDYILKEVQYV